MPTSSAAALLNAHMAGDPAQRVKGEVTPPTLIAAALAVLNLIAAGTETVDGRDQLAVTRRPPANCCG